MPVVTTSPCMVCGRTSQITLTDAEFAALGTTYIQVALPDRSADERELVKTGTHPACWAIAFPDEEDEEYNPDDGCGTCVHTVGEHDKRGCLRCDCDQPTIR